MKYSIVNQGTGVVMIRLFVPDFQVSSFLSFMEQKKRENPPVIRKSPLLHDENYFINLRLTAVNLFTSFVVAGLPQNAAISDTLKQLKTGDFHNISYDRLRQILTKNGCFRSEKR